MITKSKFLFAFLWAALLGSSPNLGAQQDTAPALLTGAEQPALYLPLLQEAGPVALVVNQTSTVGHAHLVDTLLAMQVDIQTIFAPEHGFRGDADAGEKIADGKDPKTGLPIISLYGSNKKPKPEQLQGLGMVIFDIQDVGARFYTYISTMHYVMEACAEAGIPVLVLDRPNPNGHYVDGPLLDPSFQSFVGMHPVPVVHGMTIAEYAQMINGEGWLAGGATCKLHIVPCAGYTHQTAYELPVPPSPNLPNARSIYLYPSLCFFEGTNVSVGRGTPNQFQVIGHPDSRIGDYHFTPQPRYGARSPKHNGASCRGYSFVEVPPAEIREEGQLNLSYLIAFFEDWKGSPESFFLKTLFIDKLAGSDLLRKQILAGMSAREIRKTWAPGLEQFKPVRKKYLLYPE